MDSGLSVSVSNALKLKQEKSCYHPDESFSQREYNLRNIWEKEDIPMSFLCTVLHPDGIVMASDSRSTKSVPGIGLSLVDDHTKKVFCSSDLIVGAYGTNVVYKRGKDAPLSEMIERAVSVSGNAAEFAQYLLSFHLSDTYLFYDDYSFLVGEKQRNTPVLHEFHISNGILRMTAFYKAPDYIMSATNILPSYRVINTNLSLQALKDIAIQDVQAVISFGKMLEAKGIVDVYHVGGPVQVEEQIF